MNSGLVSIITPTYNCGRFIAETILSVQAQTWQDWEMIIVDDCSTDNTHNVVESFQQGDPRILYFRNPANCGAAMSRNKALQMARGRWVAFLDSDDLWTPEKLSRQIRFMEENGYAFTYHQYEKIDEDSRPLGVLFSGLSHVTPFLMFSCCWPGCLSVMYDREKIGLIQIKDVKKNNDTAIWLKAIRKADCYLLAENLGKYRVRTGSITPRGIWSKIKAHYPLFRVAEGMNPARAWFWTLMNVAGNVWKKLFYIKAISAQ